MATQTAPSNPDRRDPISPAGARRRGGRPQPALASGALRLGGRVVLWAVVALVAVRGVGDIVAGDEPATDRPVRVAGGVVDGQARAFAISFVRSYLSPPGGGRPAAGFLADGLGDRAADSVPPRGPGAQVAWAMVVREASLGGSRALVTVAAFLADGRVRYVAVPIARDARGRPSVFDLPSFHGPPPAGTAPPATPVPLDGPHAGALADLAGRFVRDYVAGSGSGRLSYLTEPGSEITPLDGDLEVAEVEDVAQADSDSGRLRTLVVSVRVRDRETGGVYPLAYRLEVVRRDRWYVAAVHGGPRR